MAVHTILLSGKQGAGKTTLANELGARLRNEKGWRCIELSFADSIYAIHDFARGRLAHYGIKPPANVSAKDGPLLQLLGTEWGRKTYGEDVWVDVLQAQMRETEERLKGAFEHLVFIIADCRFRNEFAAFPDALRVRLECDRETRKSRCSMWRENDTHQSEIDLDGCTDEFELRFNTSHDSATDIAKWVTRRLTGDV